MKKIEVEFRALLTKESHGALMKTLEEKSADLGEDDKDVYFFFPEGKILKAVHNVSRKSGKIVLKLSRIGAGSAFEEIEIPIAENDVEKAARMFRALGVPEGFHSFQKRRNFSYKGVEVAVKYSDVWGYHAELEIMINAPDEQPAAEQKIRAVADEFNLKLMSEEELRAFIARAEKENYKRGIAEK